MTRTLIFYLHFGIDKSQNMRPERMKLYIIYVIQRLYVVKNLCEKYKGPRHGTLGISGTLEGVQVWDSWDSLDAT